MDELIHLLLCPDAQGPGSQGGLLLELPPLPFLEVHAQGLSNELTLRPVFLSGGALSLSNEPRGK
jgi:hypothetical protein